MTQRYIAVGNEVLDQQECERVSFHGSDSAAKRKAWQLNRELQEAQEEKEESPEYQKGWNDAIDAAIQRLRNHDIDWLGDKSFGQMEAEIIRAVAALRRAE